MAAPRFLFEYPDRPAFPIAVIKKGGRDEQVWLTRWQRGAIARREGVERYSGGWPRGFTPWVGKKEHFQQTNSWEPSSSASACPFKYV
jgi:hypothetical protein